MMTGKTRYILFGIVLMILGIISFPFTFALVYTGTSDVFFLLPFLIITVGVNVLIRGFKK
jgi:hypothetical protein